MTRLSLAEVDALSRRHGWTGDEHCSTGGARIESWASRKSWVRKDGGEAQKRQAAKVEDAGSLTVGFRGERRSNATHRRRTDPDSG